MDAKSRIGSCDRTIQPIRSRGWHLWWNADAWGSDYRSSWHGTQRVGRWPRTVANSNHHADEQSDTKYQWTDGGDSVVWANCCSQQCFRLRDPYRTDDLSGGRSALCTPLTR